MADPLSLPPPPAGPPPGEACPGNHQSWDDGRWLDYRKQCQDFLLALGQKFVSITWQSAIFATATCAALVTAHQQGLIGRWARVGVAIPAMAGLLAYWWFGSRYFRQIKETGSLIAELEQRLFADPAARANLALLTRLRREVPLYGHGVTRWIVFGFWPLLIGLVLITALL